MAGRYELGDQALPDGTSRAGHEDPHDDSFRRPPWWAGGLSLLPSAETRKPTLL
jgi:hypothetical protein